ncbi:MAG: hypothetical protein LWX00_07125, partial [Spirochaetia bacterium]|nr:hypothetical protein [Spirochaetia bacterium]
ESAYNGYADAMVAVGEYYEFGLAGDIDYVQALAWYLIADHYGHDEAGYYAELVKETYELTDEEIAEAERLASEF